MPAVDLHGYQISDRLHAGQRCIYRGRRESDDRPVIIKTLAGDYPTRQAVAEQRREHEILRRLESVDGVIRVVALESYGDDNLAIVMEAFGEPLSEVLAREGNRALAPRQFLDVAIQVAEALGRIHQHDVVHKALEPANILLDRETGEIRIIEFSVASEISRERQDANLSGQLAGSLPYISPEQTGRMNRFLDYRSDHYSMGVTFYELLTGRTPFCADNVMEWIHCHISRPPPNPGDFNEHVPAALAQIVLKLMEKNAEDRYQSTYGLIADLETCRAQLDETGVCPAFDLGRKDVPRTFQISQNLYGREHALAELTSLVDVVSGGATELCLVSGYAGVGKSALVNELSKSIVHAKGYLIQGKFDQLQRGTAYSALAAAFRGLLLTILSESREQLDRWRAELLERLGPNGQLLVALVPELELVIGKQEPVPALPPTEAQNRFQLAFLEFVRVFANERQPLVMFLDDLQWSDAPTLNLIQRMVTAREMSHLFVIGAYRSNEVDGAHSVSLAINETRKHKTVRELMLEPLGLDSVRELTADTFRSSQGRVGPLSELLFEKTQGNPFYIRELLKSLYEDGAISYDSDEGRWVWHMEAVRRADASGNVVEFLLANIRKLPEATQQVLQLAACIGNTFDLRTLSLVEEWTAESTAERLLAALERNMVIPLDGDYRIAGKEGGESVNPSYKFQHDRIQQAAYALIESDEKRAIHLSIGRQLQKHSKPEELGERLADIVGHLNRAKDLIVDPTERRGVAEMNLKVARKARDSSAHEAALSYLQVGEQMLAEDAWHSDYELTLALQIEHQQCAYLTARYDDAEARIDRMLERARTDLEKAELLSMRTRQYATMGRMRDSITAAIRGLTLLGMPISDDPTPDAVESELRAVDENLGDREVSDLADGERLTDPHKETAIRLLMEIFPAAFLSGSGNLFPYLVLKSVNISLRHGNSRESAFAYAAYGMLLCGTLGDPRRGLEYGKLAVAMNETFDDITLKSRVIYVYGMFIHHWSNHWSTMTPWFRKGIEAGYQSGDLLYLAYSAQDCIIWDPRLDLEEAQREQQRYLRIVKDCEYQDSYDSGTLFLQMQRNFLGLTDALCSMNDDAFDEEACVEGMRQRAFMTGIANHHIYKTEICFFYENYVDALEHIREQDEMIQSSMSLPQLVRYTVVAFLTLAASRTAFDDEAWRATRSRLERDLSTMATWASNCADNFLHLQRLMEAELARLDGRPHEALDLYEDSIAAARKSGFRRDQAMANELAAKALVEAGKPRAAEGYMRVAHHLYQRWGAYRKATQLEMRYSDLLHVSEDPAETQSVTGYESLTGSMLVDSRALDLETVMRATQAISGHIVLEDLLQTIMQILLENAGGQKACFIERQSGELVVGAHHAVGETANAKTTDQAVEQLVPVSVINTVLRTQAPIVLDDAVEFGRFTTDPYVVAHHVRSVMCVPISRPGQYEGAIYIENNLSTAAFTEDRLEIVRLLSAQASISLQNAKLYQNQLRLTKAQSLFVPRQFLESLDHQDITRVGLGEYVAKEMSVMFSDLRGFTRIAQLLGPRSMIELLNSYFARLEVPIVEAGGFIDSYNGDEIMALFDVAPEKAVAAGVGMRRALEQFNRESVEGGRPQFEMGIGVNTGNLVLGTVGGGDRIQCSVVGDTVNLASRIEQLTKAYNSAFLISESTQRRAGVRDSFSTRMVDRVAVKGRADPVEIYEVLDAESPARREAKSSTSELLQGAMACYADRRFAEAVGLLSEAVGLDPDDSVLAVWSSRCARYRDSPPPEDWAGFEKLNTKY
jgi:predicted ATPase/class 3 adenylate cyclase